MDMHIDIFFIFSTVGILFYVLRKYLPEYDKYRQDTLNRNLLGVIEEQINKGNITVETIEKTLEKYKEKQDSLQYILRYDNIHMLKMRLYA